MSMIADISLVDPIRKELIRLNFFAELVRHFLSQTPESKGNLMTSGLRNLSTRGDDLLNSIAQNVPDFLDSLLIFFNELGDNVKSKMNVAGIVFYFLGFYPSSSKIADAIQEFVFSCIKGEKGEDIQNLALDCLMEAACINSSRPILLSLGFKEVLEPFVVDEQSALHFMGCLIQALLDASSNAPDNQIAGKSTSQNVILKVIKSLDEFATTSMKVVKTSDGTWPSPKQEEFS